MELDMEVEDLSNCTILLMAGFSRYCPHKVYFKRHGYIFMLAYLVLFNLWYWA